MNGRILVLGSIIAVVLLILSSLSSVIAVQTIQSQPVKVPKTKIQNAIRLLKEKITSSGGELIEVILLFLIVIMFFAYDYVTTMTGVFPSWFPGLFLATFLYQFCRFIILVFLKLSGS
jgi:hypothetical protein